MKTFLLLSLLTLTLPVLAGAEEGEGRKNACKADVEKFCKDVQPGGGRIMACLKAHDNELSADCKGKGAEMKQKMKQGKMDWEDACAGDRKKFCAEVEVGGGRILRCLHDHDKDLASGCRDFMAKKKGEFQEKHPGMTKMMEACKDDKAKYCGDAGPGEGHERVGECMKKHQGELSGSCKEAMHGMKGGEKH